MGRTLVLLTFSSNLLWYIALHGDEDEGNNVGVVGPRHDAGDENHR